MKRKQKKQNELKTIYIQASDISEEEKQRRLDNVFDILLTATLKKRHDEKNNITT